MLHKVLLTVFSFYLLTPLMITMIPTPIKTLVKQTIPVIEAPMELVPWDNYIPPIEIKSLIKYDMTEFHFKYIRPTLADFNPSYKPTVERKK